MSSSAAIDSRPPLIRLCAIRKSFGRAVALDGLSFEVAEGELFGLLGPNGAGKTTTMAILAGLLAADAGTATLGDQPLHPRNRELRRQIGIAPQDFALYLELSVEENLRFFGRLQSLGSRELESRIDRGLDAAQLTDRRRHRAGTLSGGMKRRLNLAIAVLHEPRLLLLDEPTAGVDPQSRHHLLEEIRRLNQAGTTVIYTSHAMDEAQTLCDRVAIVDHGKVIQCDTVTSLLKLGSTLERVFLNLTGHALRDN